MKVMVVIMIIIIDIISWVILVFLMLALYFLFILAMYSKCLSPRYIFVTISCRLFQRVKEKVSNLSCPLEKKKKKRKPMSKSWCSNTPRIKCNHSKNDIKVASFRHRKLTISCVRKRNFQKSLKHYDICFFFLCITFDFNSVSPLNFPSTSFSQPL